MKKIIVFLYLISFINLEAAKNKIIGLVAGKNESKCMVQCLKALSLYTDTIIYLDDASEDDTLAKVQAVAKECRIEGIIKKTEWYRDEPGDRNRLLQAGRQLGGTHFVILDADEMFTANCMHGNRLRNAILELKPGEKLQLRWIQLWRSPFKYRDDNSAYNKNHYQYFAFCDDGRSWYQSDFIHTMRVPQTPGLLYRLSTEYGVLHFPHVNWRNLLIKIAWYHCLERIRKPEKTCQEINKQYVKCTDESGLRVYDVPAEWYAGYDFFNPEDYTSPELWRQNQIKAWFNEYGITYFRDLNIWHIDWNL